MSVNTVQKLTSLISYACTGRGPMVDPDETHAHVGTLQALIGLYGGVMAVEYRPGVDADSSELELGTLRSDSTSAGTQIYFVSFDDRLPVDELITGTPTATSTNSALTISSVAVSTSALSTNDGEVFAPIGRAVEFRVTLPTSAFATTRAPILVQYATDGSNTRDAIVYLNVEYVP